MQITTISAISKRIFSGGTPSTQCDSFWNGDIPWLSSGETSNRYINHTENYITQDGVDNSSTKLAKKGSIVIASAGQGFTRGQTSFLLLDTYINQSLIAVEIDPSLANPLFVFFNLSLRYEELRSISDDTSSRGSLTTKMIGTLPINLPNRSIQDKIVSMIEFIDKKLIITQKINNNLFEELRTAIDTYFCYLPEDMPDRWKSYQLTELATIISGYPYKGNELVEDSFDALVTIKNFDRTGGFKIEGYKPLAISSRVKESQFVDLYDILVAHTDLTQGAEIIGNTEIVLSKGKYNKLVASMDLVKIEPNEAVGHYLLAALLSGYQFKSHCLGYINGTTVLHLSKDATKEYSVALPNNPDLLRKYDDYCKSIYHSIAQNMAESERLIALRDYLLPKLMSGEIDVSTLELLN